MKILYKIVNGELNKNITSDLDLSLGTIEACLAKIMKKLQVKTLAELIRKVLNYSPVFDDNRL